MRPNKVMQCVREGRLALGLAVNFYCPPLVELGGALGFDWAFIDCEHGSMDPSEVEHMVRAAEAYDITPLARVEENSPSAILRLLDRGVMGVMVPHVSTAEEARRAVRSSKFHPVGERSTAGGYRTNNYGVGRTVRDFYESTNREVMVIALVESVEGLENAAEIAAVEGLDALWVGPSDLAQSMGMPPQGEVDAAIEAIVRAARQAGKPVGVGGIGARDYDRQSHFIGVGANLVMAQATDLLKEAGAEFLAKVRSLG